MNTKLIVCTVALIAVLGGLGTVSAQSSPTPTVEPNTSSTTTPTATPTTTSSTTPTVTPTAEPSSTPTPASTAEPTSTPTPEPTSTPTPTEESRDNSTYQIAIDDDVRVVSSSWSNGKLTAVVEADRAKQLVITDASKDLTRYEATDIRRSRLTLPSGRTEVTFQVAKPSSAAVTAATSDGIVGLSPGDGSGWFDRAAEWLDVRAAGAGAGVFALIGMLGGVWWSVSDRRVDGVEVVDTEETNG